MAKSFNARMKERFALITSSYDKVNKLVHDTAMEILRHAEEHKDCSTAQGLIMALPASIRREQLILWFRLYTPIVVKNSDDWTAKMHAVDSKMFVAFNATEADANPFYELAKKNKEQAGPLDAEGILKLISRLAATLEKKVTDGEILPELEDSATAAVNQLKKIRIKASAPANDDSADKPAGKRNAA